MNLQQGGHYLLEIAGRRSPGAQVEAFVVSSESRVFEWSEGRPENTVRAQSRGAALRVIDQGRLGFASTNRLDDEGLSALADAAFRAAKVTESDPAQGLPEPDLEQTSVDLQAADPVLQNESAVSRARFLETVETEAKKRDPRLVNVLRASYRETVHASVIVSSRGLTAGDLGTTASFSLACVAVDGPETQVGYAFQAVRRWADLKTEWVIEKAVENTLALLGGKPVPSGRYDLVFDPLVAAEMLELLATALRADQVQKGRSFLAGRIGQTLGADCLNLIDDGRLVRGLGSSLVDAEGVPTRTTPVVERGILRTYLYDSFTARKEGRRSTGNAGRASYKGMPEPEATNFYLQPGTRRPEQLLADVGSGLYVQQVMGLHTVDTVSGEFSLGLMGQKIEGGVRTHGVRGVTIAGNMLELLRHVVAVGSDLMFVGSVGAPTLWVRGISVGGM